MAKEYIEREALLQRLSCNPYIRFIVVADTDGMWINGRDAISVIREAPVADVVEVERGEWEICEESNNVDTYGNPYKYARCTQCGFRWDDLYSAKTYFERCPHCGADMRERRDNEC